MTPDQKSFLMDVALGVGLALACILLMIAISDFCT